VGCTRGSRTNGKYCLGVRFAFRVEMTPCSHRSVRITNHKPTNNIRTLPEGCPGKVARRAHSSMPNCREKRSLLGSTFLKESQFGSHFMDQSSRFVCGALVLMDPPSHALFIIISNEHFHQRSSSITKQQQARHIRGKRSHVLCSLQSLRVDCCLWASSVATHRPR
jgi:hypothetical protein